MCLRCLYVSKDKHGGIQNSIQLSSRSMTKFVEPYGSLKQGSGSKCQDTITIMPNFAHNTHFFAVYDGAGPQGYEIANRSETKMREYLEKSHSTFVSYKHIDEYKNFLKAGFKAIQDDLEASKMSYDVTKSCVCCSSVLIVGNMAIVANIGNCRVVLQTKNKEGVKIPVDLSSDHTVESLREKERCLRAGAKISAGPPLGKERVLGPERIWCGNDGPGVITTRMLGYNKCGVIPEPEITVFEIKKTDHFMVIGSDGLWNVLESKEVVSFIDEIQERRNASEDLINCARKIWESEYSDPEFRFIGDEITQKGCDDISVVLVFLNHSK